MISNEIRIPQNLIIDRTWKVKDSVLLKELGIINFNESFTFYSSIVTSFHIFIYNKVNISNNLKKLNPPIRVNGLLITPENYSNLLLKDTVNIKSINFIPSKKLVEFYNLPIGIIDIQLK